MKDFFAEMVAPETVGWNDGAPSTTHAPFGGTKESGIGSKDESEGVEPYLETIYLSIGNL